MRYPTWAKENLKNEVIQGGLDPKFYLNQKQMYEGDEIY